MNILFTGYNFDAYHGSMMLICEIGSYLKSLGHNIFIASLNITPRIKKETDKLGFKLFSIEKIPKNVEYDIIWTYHFPFLAYLIENNIKYKKIIHGCLSGLLIPIETPSFLCFKNNIPIYVNSNETKEKLSKNFPTLENKFKILLNLVPDEFFKYTKKDLPKKQRKIAIVSNHIPKELYETKKLLKKEKIAIDIYGVGKNIKITPEILIKYDTVITIGKTVQYCLALGIPVYNYDYMGGSGYINLENIDTEEYYNFSGRSLERKLNAKELSKEIIENYQNTIKDLNKLQKIAKERYLLSKNIDKILEEINNSQDNIINLSQEEKLYCKHICDLTNKIIRYKNITNMKNNILLVFLKYCFYGILSKVLFGNIKLHYKEKTKKCYHLINS